jgi:hypothetical protein
MNISIKNIVLNLLLTFISTNSFSQIIEVVDSTVVVKEIVKAEGKTTFFVKPVVNDSVIAILFPKGKKTEVNLENLKINTASNSKWYNKISLRQSFQSIDSRAEPAYLTLVFPKDSESSQNFSLALGYNLLSEKNPTSFIYPFIEWQKNTLTTKKQNNFLAGFNFQTPLRNINKGIWRLYSISSLNYKHDAIKETKGLQTNLYFTPSFDTSDEGFFVAPNIISKNKIIEYYYNIYVGMEFENRSKGMDENYNGNTGRWYGRITGTFYPWGNKLDKKLEIIPDFTYRNAFVNSSLIEDRINRLFKLSINVVIVDSGFINVKLGYEYKNGSDPTVGFEKQSINSLTLKIKI